MPHPGAQALVLHRSVVRTTALPCLATPLISFRFVGVRVSESQRLTQFPVRFRVVFHEMLVLAHGTRGWEGYVPERGGGGRVVSQGVAARLLTSIHAYIRTEGG